MSCRLAVEHVNGSKIHSEANFNVNKIHEQFLSSPCNLSPNRIILTNKLDVDS